MSKEIRGKRVILREQREADAPFFAYWFNQPDVMFQCGFEKPTNEEEIKKSITANHQSKDSVWFTITDLDGNMIGETGLLRMFPAWHQTDLILPLVLFELATPCVFRQLGSSLWRIIPGPPTGGSHPRRGPVPDRLPPN